MSLKTNRRTGGQRLKYRSATSTFLRCRFSVRLTRSKPDVRKFHSFEGGFLGTPSISYQTSPAERKKTGKKRGIKNEAKNFNQKSTPSDRIEKSRLRLGSDQGGQSSLRQGRQQRNDYT